MASMVDCKKTQEQLSAYIDNELSSEEIWDIRLHLASCAVCAHAHQELSATVLLVQSLPAGDTSPGFEDALARRLADQALRPRRPSLSWWIQDRLEGIRELPRLRSTLAAAGVLAVMIPAVILYTAAQRTPPTPDVASQAVMEEQQFVDSVMEEHASYAAAIPLSDEAAVMLSATRDRSVRN